MRDFSRANRIGFPLLSDQGSEVIRRFGIINTNIPPDVRSYGVPFPVEYLLGPDGTVKNRFFVPNYQNRVAGSAVMMREFGIAMGDKSARITSGALAAEIRFSASRAFAGQELAVMAEFALEPGWHIYGEPLPGNYTKTAIRFDTQFVSHYEFKFPAAKPVKLAPLGETLPVYEGKFRAIGRMLLRFPLNPGECTITGTLSFQQCSDAMCEAPQVIRFQLPLTIDPAVAEVKKN